MFEDEINKAVFFVFLAIVVAITIFGTTTSIFNNILEYKVNMFAIETAGKAIENICDIFKR